VDTFKFSKVCLKKIPRSEEKLLIGFNLLIHLLFKYCLEIFAIL
jgi:hypothetical protein